MSGGQQPAPTPIEIARECEAIQAEWTPEEKRKRHALAYCPPNERASLITREHIVAFLARDDMDAMPEMQGWGADGRRVLRIKPKGKRWSQSR